MANRAVILEKEGPVAFLRLARPESGNRVDEHVLRELEAACTEINDDTDVRVAVLKSDGSVFSDGWEGRQISDGSMPARLGGAPFRCLESTGQPVICALNGDAHSAGLELALACDVRIAAETARFSLPETSAGTIPAGGGTQRLARLSGRAHALRMVLLADPIDAAEALRIGLVSAVFPDDKLQAEAKALALRMASRGPIALRYAKEAVRRGLELPIDEALRIETDLTVILQTTEDRAEGVSAFVEKREPDFKGR